MYDLKLIKKHYGEKMMHLCRELFPSFLEKEGLLFSLLESNFAYSKFLYDDVIDELEAFKNYIYSLVDVEKNVITELKSPEELLEEAGYILYECKTEEDIQKFKKYYAKDEELCTFRGNRLNYCHVFFAVKKDANNLKREDFKIPKRQDEYGTSVISIQFSKGEVNTLSIKNRYNHTVNNPDATFSNNLENIIEGLTNSFERKYNLNINQNKFNDFELDGYLKANDGKFYKYNYEINNIYYCPDNIIIDNFEVKYYEKEKYLIIDYFILDLVNKKIFIYDSYISKFENSFEDFKQIKINKIQIINNKEQKEKKITITLENEKRIYIDIDKYNRMVSFKNENIIFVDYSYFLRNKFLRKIDLPNALGIGCGFLYNNTELTEINISNVKKIYDDFLFSNKKLKELDLPKVLYIGKNFLGSNYRLKQINLPIIEYISDNFLPYNLNLIEINLPNTLKIGSSFLQSNTSLEKIKLPNVEVIKNHFLRDNNSIKEIELPKVTHIGHNFLIKNELIKKIKLLNVKVIGDNFLYKNKQVDEINLKNVEQIGDNFLFNNISLERINLPKLRIIGDKYLFNNKKILKFWVNLIINSNIKINNYNDKVNSKILRLIRKDISIYK